VAGAGIWGLWRTGPRKMGPGGHAPQTAGSAAYEDHAWAGFGRSGPGCGDVGQGKGPERHLDGAVGDELDIGGDFGFCVEEQAIEAGDERYSPGRRAELIGRQTAPLAVEAGSVIFGDPDTRFTELVELLLDSVARMRSRDGGHDVPEK
jgi:hypothetical protein